MMYWEQGTKEKLSLRSFATFNVGTAPSFSFNFRPREAAMSRLTVNAEFSKWIPQKLPDYRWETSYKHFKVAMYERWCVKKTLPGGYPLIMNR